MYKAKLEEGKDNPSSIWKLFRELGAGKNLNLMKILSALMLILNLYVVIKRWLMLSSNTSPCVFNAKIANS